MLGKVPGEEHWYIDRKVNSPRVSALRALDRQQVAHFVVGHTASDTRRAVRTSIFPLVN